MGLCGCLAKDLMHSCASPASVLSHACKMSLSRLLLECLEIGKLTCMVVIAYRANVGEICHTLILLLSPTN